MASVEIIRSGQIVYSARPGTPKVSVSFRDEAMPDLASAHYHARLVQSDGQIAWSTLDLGGLQIVRIGVQALCGTLVSPAQTGPQNLSRCRDADRRRGIGWDGQEVNVLRRKSVYGPAEVAAQGRAAPAFQRDRPCSVPVSDGAIDPAGTTASSCDGPAAATSPKRLRNGAPRLTGGQAWAEDWARTTEFRAYQGRSAIWICATYFGPLNCCPFL